MLSHLGLTEEGGGRMEEGRKDGKGVGRTEVGWADPDLFSCSSWETDPLLTLTLPHVL